MYITGIGTVFDKNRKDKPILKDIRRADDLSKMAVFAAYAAYVDSGLNDDAKDNLGLILSTAFGPHVTTFRFLDEILDYGDGNVSPTLFSHSVHNAANAYISSNLGIHGPTLTLTNFSQSFYQGLLVAQSWLDEGRCKNVLVGSLEQYGKEMGYILSCAAPELTFKEGSAFFLVSSEEGLKKYCSISVLGYKDEFASGLNLAASLLKDKTIKC